MSKDFLARLKAGELIPLRGQPKTPEFALAYFERFLQTEPDEETA